MFSMVILPQVSRRLLYISSLAIDWAALVSISICVSCPFSSTVAMKRSDRPSLLHESALLAASQRLRLCTNLGHEACADSDFLNYSAATLGFLNISDGSRTSNVTFLMTVPALCINEVIGKWWVVASTPVATLSSWL